jgi:hypothetical protein
MDLRTKTDKKAYFFFLFLVDFFMAAQFVVVAFGEFP